jgi:4-hydroxy-3-methylbut-2-enyl diphosphate reductase
MSVSHIKTRFKIEGKPAPEMSWRYFDSDLLERITSKEVTVDSHRGWRLGAGRLEVGALTFHLARKFGFCYGVKLAIMDSLSAIDRYPGQRILALSEMIHNPYVNGELERRGTIFMDRSGLTLSDVRPSDVVIIPAFGTTVGNFDQLKALAATGATLIDTTCRSVIDVWDRIAVYNQLGMTSVIHGKSEHEETIATASQADRFLIVRDLVEAELVCEFIRGRGAADDIKQRFSQACSRDFDPRRDLVRIGLANQTTMRSSESEEVFALFRETLLDVYGSAALDAHYQGLDTICRATEVRQQAVVDLVRDTALDLMLVIGGFNSSNTRNLAKIARQSTPTYHIEGAWAFDGERITHLEYGAASTIETTGWLPAAGHIGLTAGASTPDNTVGEVIERILALRPQGTERSS